MADETKNPSRDRPLRLLGSMSTIMVIYCLMALSTVMMQKYTDRPKCSILCSISECGMKWAKYLVALAAQKGMTTVLLVGTPGRHNTHIAQDEDEASIP